MNTPTSDTRELRSALLRTLDAVVDIAEQSKLERRDLNADELVRGVELLERAYLIDHCLHAR